MYFDANMVKINGPARHTNDVVNMRLALSIKAGEYMEGGMERGEVEER
jgi:hypothetical protein